MNLFKSIKCIICLVKCSKYLYFLKKALCCATLVFTAITVISCCFNDGNKKNECKKLISKLKAVM